MATAGSYGVAVSYERGSSVVARSNPRATSDHPSSLRWGASTANIRQPRQVSSPGFPVQVLRTFWVEFFSCESGVAQPSKRAAHRDKSREWNVSKQNETSVNSSNSENFSEPPLVEQDRFRAPLPSKCGTYKTVNAIFWPCEFQRKRVSISNFLAMKLTAHMLYYY